MVEETHTHTHGKKGHWEICATQLNATHIVYISLLNVAISFVLTQNNIVLKIHFFSIRKKNIRIEKINGLSFLISFFPSSSKHFNCFNRDSRAVYSSISVCAVNVSGFDLIWNYYVHYKKECGIFFR